MEERERARLERAVAEIAGRDARFHAATRQCVDVMTEALVEHIGRMASLLKARAELAGRQRVNVMDVSEMLQMAHTAQ